MVSIAKSVGSDEAEGETLSAPNGGCASEREEDWRPEEIGLCLEGRLATPHWVVSPSVGACANLLFPVPHLD